MLKISLCPQAYGGLLIHLFLVGYFVFMVIDRKADRDCSRGQGYDRLLLFLFSIFKNTFFFFFEAQIGFEI